MGASEHVTAGRNANNRWTWRRAASLRASRGLLAESLETPNPTIPWHGTGAARGAAADGGSLAPGPARGLGIGVSDYPTDLPPADGEAAVGGRASGAVAGAGSGDRVGSPLAAALALLRLPGAGPQVRPSCRC